jgi:basic membrane lipoprotein Med (substrate-binding protein (PBP1-ABC) superfamily)
VWEIAHLGATAILYDNETIRDYSINQMKLLEDKLTRERVTNTLNEHIQQWQTFKGDKSLKMTEALKKLAEYYNQPEIGDGVKNDP